MKNSDQSYRNKILGYIKKHKTQANPAVWAGLYVSHTPSCSAVYFKDNIQIEQRKTKIPKKNPQLLYRLIDSPTYIYYFLYVTFFCGDFCRQKVTMEETLIL